MKKNSAQFIAEQTFWYVDKKLFPPLRHDISADVVIVGGGMAGLSAAQSFAQKGLSVALLEQHFCGAGATGKSSGFITPDSEFSFHNLIRVYGQDTGTELWKFIISGVEFIRNNITTHTLACDYRIEDTLVVSTSASAQCEMEKEHEARLAHRYPSTLYNRHNLPTIIGTTAYYGGVRYPDTFGISAYRYCAEMKKVLHQHGVALYEESPVTEITATGVKTTYAQVKADKVIVCVDRFLPQLHKFLYDIYHVQTFLMMSAPLTQEQAQTIFPEAPLMVWDTEMIYNYFRLTTDNRLLLGGAHLLSTYARQETYHNKRVQHKLLTYFAHKFPTLQVSFEYIWPGLIGITKDIMALAGRDKEMPQVYYISGAVGLPWAAALGNYAAQHMLEGRSDFDAIFFPYRSFTLGHTAQKMLGTPLTFAICNLLRTKSL